MKPATLKGERIILRPLRMSDAKTLVLCVNDKKLMKYHMASTARFSLNDEKKYIKRTMKNWKIGNDLEWAIELYGKLIGAIFLHNISKKNLSAEFGIWVARENQRKGIGYESAKLVINFAFKRLKLNRIWYYTYTPNKASKNLARQLGAKYEGMQREVAKKGKVFYDSYTYGILKREWKE
jgi:RimJ/RimL family protein N-acetyltransferase